MAPTDAQKTPLRRKEKEISEQEGQMLQFMDEHWDSVHAGMTHWSGPVNAKKL